MAQSWVRNQQARRLVTEVQLLKDKARKASQTPDRQPGPGESWVPVTCDKPGRTDEALVIKDH